LFVFLPLPLSSCGNVKLLLPPEDAKEAIVRPPKKKCPFCRRVFLPDPRVGERQKACSRKECRRRRKALSQKNWTARNPEYFRGRYENTRVWIEQHPGYLQGFRAAHPEYAEKNRVRSRERKRELARDEFDIQDKIKSQLVEMSRLRTRNLQFDIQDEIITQQAGLAQIMLKFMGLIYKTR
jgi:hypothetical protein